MFKGFLQRWRNGERVRTIKLTDIDEIYVNEMSQHGPDTILFTSPCELTILAGDTIRLRIIYE